MLQRQDKIYSTEYYSINENGTFYKIDSLDKKFLVDEPFVIIKIVHGAFIHGHYENRSNTFTIFDKNFREIGYIERNGWILEFSEPLMGPFYNNYDDFLYYFKDLIHPETPNSSGLGKQEIKIENFVYAIQRLLHYSNYKGFQLADISFKNQELESENEGLAETIKLLEKEVERLKNALSEVS